ncbi:MAG: CDP-glucose 4,6-dehydratase [Vulcanimicrobiaceae bacterium]
MEALGLDPAFWRGCRVFVTGHTGFKGAWLSFWLRELGAVVCGYSLAPETSPNLFSLLRLSESMDSRLGDVRQADLLADAIAEFEPLVIVHLAAQALVRRGYADPLHTFATNAMGTAGVLQAARSCASVRSIVVITSDKCYANETAVGSPFNEDDPLGGYDPYSASKACAEIITAAYRRSYFSQSTVVVASARAGNVIGGGDWSQDRLIPDVVRSVHAGLSVELRNPDAIRPWQHVFESLWGYLLLAQRGAAGDRSVAGAWNFGPDHGQSCSVSEVVELFGRALETTTGWYPVALRDALHEAPALLLDASKAQRALGWKPRLSTLQAVSLTAAWYRRFFKGDDVGELCREQLSAYVA